MPTTRTSHRLVTQTAAALFLAAPAAMGQTTQQAHPPTPGAPSSAAMQQHRPEMRQAMEKMNRDMTGVPPHLRDVNTVFQSYALFPHLNVQDNVAFGLKMKNVPASQVRERVMRALDTVLPLPGTKTIIGQEAQEVSLTVELGIAETRHADVPALQEAIAQALPDGSANALLRVRVVHG